MTEESGRKRYDDEPFTKGDFYNLCNETVPYRLSYILDGGFGSVLTQKN